MMQASRWFVFELSSDSDLNDALDWLRRAYEAADLSRPGAKSADISRSQALVISVTQGYNSAIIRTNVR